MLAPEWPGSPPLVLARGLSVRGSHAHGPARGADELPLYPERSCADCVSAAAGAASDAPCRVPRPTAANTASRLAHLALPQLFMLLPVGSKGRLPLIARCASRGCRRQCVAAAASSARLDSRPPASVRGPFPLACRGIGRHPAPVRRARAQDGLRCARARWYEREAIKGGAAGRGSRVRAQECPKRAAQPGSGNQRALSARAYRYIAQTGGTPVSAIAISRTETGRRPARAGEMQTARETGYMVAPTIFYHHRRKSVAGAHAAHAHRVALQTCLL